MPGKDPHRPEGKAGIDSFHHRASMRKETDLPKRTDEAPAPSRYDAEEQIGGSRPGVPSRVKDALTRKSDDE